MPARSNSPRVAGLDGGPPIRTPDPDPNEAERFMPRLSVDLARWFLERAGVACVPGSAFGLDPFLRLSFAAPSDSIEMACARLRGAVRELA